MFRCELSGELSKPGERPRIVVTERYGKDDYTSVRRTKKIKCTKTRKLKEIYFYESISLEGQIKKEIKIRAKYIDLVKEAPIVKVPKEHTYYDDEFDWIITYKRIKYDNYDNEYLTL